MKIHFLLSLLVVVSLAPGLAAAQGNETAPDRDGGGLDLENPELLDNCAEPEPIDRYTVICSADLDGNTAEIVLRSDRPQRVSITDGAALMTGGEMRRESRQLRPDEPNTVRFTVTKYRGMAAVTIDTNDALYGVPLQEPSTLIGGPWSSQDVQVGAIAAAVGTSFISVAVVLRAVLGRSDEPERVA